MIPKKIYLNYVNENDTDKTWSEEPVSVYDCKMQSREYTDLSQVWHDASEEPKEGEFIVCVDDYNDFDIGAYYVDRVDALNRVYESAVWNYGELVCYWDCVKIWAYARDLLPKGGEK